MGEGEFHALLGYAYWLRGDWSQARELVRAGLAARYGPENPMVSAVAVLAHLETRTLDPHRDRARAALREAPWPQAISMAAAVEFLLLGLSGQHDEQSRYLDELHTDFVVDHMGYMLEEDGLKARFAQSIPSLSRERPCKSS